MPKNFKDILTESISSDVKKMEDTIGDMIFQFYEDNQSKIKKTYTQWYYAKNGPKDKLDELIKSMVKK